MRRWLAILLLVLLPTQMSWAAVADYCAHETGAAADHVGHHDHTDHGHAPATVDVSDQSGADEGAASTPDADCGHCHGQCTGMLASLATATHDRATSAPTPAGDAPCAAHAAAQPERPQWARLA
ncbi:hypothetical protein [Piscinibacter sakaiensis]|uniref:hypothetical protein n=1 Tax=Piscinibacter sakaiensis TaxID=1547922 RepID=UPI0009EC6C81|nr:hypothetical protein [Piscinibacter sakaiensis]